LNDALADGLKGKRLEWPQAAEGAIKKRGSILPRFFVRFLPYRSCRISSFARISISVLGQKSTVCG